MSKQWSLYHICDHDVHNQPSYVPNKAIAPQARTLGFKKTETRKQQLDVIRKREDMISNKFRNRSILQQRLVNKFGLRYAVVIRKTVDNFVSKISTPLSHEDLMELEPKLIQIIENNIDKVSQDTVKTRHKAHMSQIRKKPVPIQQQSHRIHLDLGNGQDMTSQNNYHQRPHSAVAAKANVHVESGATSRQSRRPQSALPPGRPNQDASSIQATKRIPSSARPQSATMVHSQSKPLLNFCSESPRTRPFSATLPQPPLATSIGPQNAHGAVYPSANSPHQNPVSPFHRHPSGRSRSTRNEIERVPPSERRGNGFFHDNSARSTGKSNSGKLSSGRAKLSHRSDIISDRSGIFSDDDDDGSDDEIWFKMPYMGRQSSFQEVPRWAASLRAKK